MASIAVAVQAGKRAKLKQLEGQAHSHLAADESREIDRRTWPWIREFLYQVIHNHLFEGACGAIILFNMVLVVIETDASVGGGSPPLWALVMTKVLLGIYTIELVTKMYVYRFDFFLDKWNVLDFLIVGMDWVLLCLGLIMDKMPSISILRVFRLVRLARAVKAASFFHELNALIRSFTCALKAIFWGILMILMCLMIWGILAVQIIHPVNEKLLKNKPHIYDGCDRCHRAFESVFDSMLTFFQQLVAGDAWGEITNPIIEEAPWTSSFFLLVLVTVSLTMMNLILAVIVEAGAAAAAEDEHENAMQMHKKVIKAQKKLIECCERLDTDNSGALNVEEFMGGFESDMEFKDALQVMHVNETDLQMIFNICDEDGSGDVNYREFVEQLQRIKDSGEKMLLYYVTDIRHMVTRLKSQLGVLPTKRDHLMKRKDVQPKDMDMEPKENVSEVVAGEVKVDASINIDDKSPQPPSADVFSTLGSKEATEVSIVRSNSPEEDVAPLLSNDIQQQVLTMLQSTTAQVDQMSSKKLERLLKINEDLVTILTDVGQQSKVQTGLLQTLASEVPSIKASRGCAIPAPGLCSGTGAVSDSSQNRPRQDEVTLGSLRALPPNGDSSTPVCAPRWCVRGV